MSGGRYLPPGARVRNELPEFLGSDLRNKKRQQSTKKQQSGKHVPQQSSLWTNPGFHRPKVKSRLADAEFTIELGMPVTVGKPSLSTDSSLAAFSRNGVKRREVRGDGKLFVKIYIMYFYCSHPSKAGNICHRQYP